MILLYMILALVIYAFYIGILVILSTAALIVLAYAIAIIYDKIKKRRH